jgi:PAS domain S-box-containing protein
MRLVAVADSWDNTAMTLPAKPGRPDVAPALYRLLAESALSRAALGACGVPLALIDANSKTRPLTYVNAAFEAFFGYREGDSLGRPLAALVFRSDEALVQRLLTESPCRWELSAWGKDGEVRHVEVALAALRDAAGRITHHVVAFSDRGELERLRAEVESLKSLAAASLGVRLDPGIQPARGAQEARIEVAASDELYPDRQAAGILHQR